MNSSQTRRQFIGKTSLATAGIGLGLSLSARTYAQSKGANDKLVFGVIGCGGISRHNVSKMMQLPGVEFAAVCDVDEKHMENGAEQITKAGRPEPKRYKDFRHLLEQKHIDGVIINTPDHWHALPFIAACEAGKDIYCEKPISHSFIEAKAMMNAASHFNRVVQVGTWQRSMNHFNEAINFVRSGKMGDINICRAWAVNDAESRNSDIGKKTPETAPASLDYDFWLGPAPKRPYQANRAHYSWRWFFDYGGGLMTDWGVHMIDTVLLGMNQFDPLTVSAAGGKFTTNDDRDTPDTMQATYRFPKWLLQWENRFNNKRGLDCGKGHGAEFIGTKGTLIVDRDGYQYFPEKEGNEAPPPSKKQDSTHWQNFVDCIKSRQKPASDIDSMGRTTMLCHLGNIALQTGKTLHWDVKKQDVTNRGDVKGCISYAREYRKPWKLKMYKA
ncbi:MAG: Gfo/Idh/MocA family oxidoreductase [Verrucomicrobia bacterium]|nr:Gfo/Idh/MocA family oxidoreductase [Verrucomicrobiota bacterium]